MKYRSKYSKKFVGMGMLAYGEKLVCKRWKNKSAKKNYQNDLTIF
jgi:hypothetical protein